MPSVTDQVIQELIANNAAAKFLTTMQAHRNEAEQLVQMVRSLHSFVDTSAMTFGVTVKVGVNGLGPSISGESDSRPTLRAATSLHLHDRPNAYILRSDGVHVLHELPDPAPDPDSISYRYEGPAREYFVVPDGTVGCSPPPYGATSFGGAYYEELEDALAVYERKMVQPMACFRLRQIWVNELTMLTLANRPEHIMRDSLVQFLTGSLRQQDNVLVLPEQNVDESHPVDVRVEWDGARRLALIEIKWLGKSKHESDPRVSTEYSDSRAVEGEQQLADYLDAMEDRIGWASVLGYLVIFDARRRNMRAFEEPISRANGLYYVTSAITFPSHLVERNDLRAPIRWFMAPASAGLTG